MSGLGVPGGDLPVPSGPGVPAGLIIPAAELTERFSRSSGPGGQSVNTSDSRVELEFCVETSQALARLPGPVRSRALAALGPVVVEVASEHRSQHRNRSAARERLAARVRSALAPPPPTRRATRPTLGSKRRRLEAKRQRGATKALRGRVQE